MALKGSSLFVMTRVLASHFLYLQKDHPKEIMWTPFPKLTWPFWCLESLVFWLFLKMGSCLLAMTLCLASLLFCLLGKTKIKWSCGQLFQDYLRLLHVSSPSSLVFWLFLKKLIATTLITWDFASLLFYLLEKNKSEAEHVVLFSKTPQGVGMSRVPCLLAALKTQRHMVHVCAPWDKKHDSIHRMEAGLFYSLESITTLLMSYLTFHFNSSRLKRWIKFLRLEYVIPS